MITKLIAPVYCLFILAVWLWSCNFSLTECDEVKDWKIEDYRIVESRCLGPAGPPYYPLSVYFRNKSIGSAFQKDSCTVTCQPNSNLYIIFDICRNTLTSFKPDKKLIDIGLVDSIQIFSTQLNLTKRLSRKSTEKFIRDWNKSKTSDYREGVVDSVFHPIFQYKLTIHTKMGKNEFLGFNFLVSNRTNWTYFIDEDKDIRYFDELWKK